MCMCDAEVIFKLLNSHNSGVHTQQSCRHTEAKHTDEAEEREPERKVRTVMVLKFTGGLGLTEAGDTEFKDIDWDEQGAATTRQGITRMCACCQEILKEERSLSFHTSVLYFFMLTSGTHASPPVLEMIQITCLKFCKKCLSLYCNLLCLIFFVHFLLV